MNRLFTLIELIIVIVVLGILAAIVIPNIGNVKDNATYVAVKSNQSAVQMAIDRYSLDHSGNLPVVGEGVEIEHSGVHTESDPSEATALSIDLYTNDVEN